MRRKPKFTKEAIINLGANLGNFEEWTLSKKTKVQSAKPLGYHRDLPEEKE